MTGNSPNGGLSNVRGFIGFEFAAGTTICSALIS